MLTLLWIILIALIWWLEWRILNKEHKKQGGEDI